MNLDPPGRLMRLCPTHSRVLERADSGEGLMCPAGDEGWHAVAEADAITVDRHTGNRVEQASTEEENVPKPKTTTTTDTANLCPKCSRPKKGRNARDGEPCPGCRRKGAAPARRRERPAEETPAPRAAAAAARATKAGTLERARFVDKRRTLTLALVQRPTPKAGGDAFLVRWAVGGGKVRKRGIATSAPTEELARKAWLRMLRAAEEDEGWTKAPPKGARQLRLEMFPRAIGKPSRAA